jgi:hypothetical protein
MNRAVILHQLIVMTFSIAATLAVAAYPLLAIAIPP